MISNHLYTKFIAGVPRAFQFCTLTGNPLLSCGAMISVLACLTITPLNAAPSRFTGAYYSGEGDVEYLRLLDTSRRMFSPDAQYQNLPMLYMPSWNGLVEGPTWDAWWIQNSYGTTYSILPFLEEPFITFLGNSHDLWFDQMGDGKRKGAEPPFDWVAPDGALCDAARPGWIVYKQGDGQTRIHDWGMEFTAAGLLMQSELLLISRDQNAINRYLPKLERCATFIESRRNPTNNLFLAGPAGNLLAPSFAGWKKPDGSYDKAYLTGLSVTYIAALDRLIELEKLAKRSDKAALYAEHRVLALKGLQQLVTEEGYLIRSMDPDGTRHGVYGAAKHGYFEASPNHDAIAFRVVEDQQARRIYDKIASIPGLRPYQFVIPNYPSYDDMYEKPEGLWAFGTWVNGGHWSTCEARMILGYYRLGCFEDARRSMKALLGFADRFRMDNPLVKFGSDVYQPNQPVNLTYDAFGPPAAFIRGLFECVYGADKLTLYPHIPSGITRLEQNFPIRYGTKLIYLAVTGSGAISSVQMNGKPWKNFSSSTVDLPYDALPLVATVEIVLGSEMPRGMQSPKANLSAPGLPPNDSGWDWLKKNAQAAKTESIDVPSLLARAEMMRRFHDRLDAKGLSGTYEAAHARLVLSALNTAHQRFMQLSQGHLNALPNMASQNAADRLYVDTVNKLIEGLSKHMDSVRHSTDKDKQIIASCWSPLK